MHSCCEGWEIDIDEDRLFVYKGFPEIASKISEEGIPHFILTDEGKCPFLRDDNLCQMIIDHGEKFLCQICSDHPRFRNFWTDRIEVGLGLACEEAGRIILGSKEPMKLVVISDDGNDTPLPADEEWLMDVRQNLFDQIKGNGPEARLLEYLIYRHIADALYDDRLEERVAFIQKSYDSILDQWEETSGTFEDLVECARKYSAEFEYKA